MPRTPVATLAELLKPLGNVPLRRIRANPPPGTATERDLLEIHRREQRLYELVDGVLVEKVMGYPESSLACDLIILLGNFLAQHDLGNLAGADGTMRLMAGLVRIPDVSFVRWEKLPDRRRPRKAIPGLVPDLAVEVLSEGNTPGEMKRKLKDYFLAGVQLAWIVDPRARTVEVYTAPDQVRVLTEADTLDGGEVLPGFSLSLDRLFARVTSDEPPSGRQSGGRRRSK